MADKIKITPEELQAQAVEMKTLEGDFSILFSGVSSDLKKVNTNWSPNLSHNFEGKINSAQNSFTQITQELMNGAKVADTCAVTFHSIDSELSKLYCTDADVSAKSSASFWDIVKEEFADIPEDAKTAGKALAWLEKQYGKLPDWITHGVDILVPSSLQTAYNLTSGILQGDITLKDGWDAVTSILKKNSKLAIICESINYTFETGTARSEEMEKEIFDQLGEGDVLGAVFDGAEGFVDTIIGGSVEVLGDVGGGLVDSAIDNIPIVKGINKLAEYGTGLLGWNDGDGYSVGGLIGAGTEKISEGIDIATDFITDKVDVVTDAVTDGVKAGINWVKGWFD